jgi:hypothetical protein
MAFIGNTPQNQGFTPAIDYFNGDGVTVTFTLSRPIASVAQVIVAIDNVIQNPSSSFTVAGSAITFSSAPLSGTNNIWVEYTSLITTYQAISQDPTVIGDIRATGGYLAEGDFGNSFVDGVILDYVTGLGRITVGSAEGIALYNGGTSARTALAAWDTSGNLVNTGNLSSKGINISSYSLYQGLATRVGNGYGVGINSANSTDNAYIYFGYGTSGAQQQGAAIGRIGGDVLSFYTGGTQRGSFDASGNLQFNSGYGSVATAYGCRAWVNFNGTGAISIRSSGGVTSISDDGTGSYTMNFSFTMPDVNYNAVGISSVLIGTSETIVVPNFTPPGSETASTTTTFKFAVLRPSVTSAADVPYVYLSVFR